MYRSCNKPVYHAAVTALKVLGTICSSNAHSELQKVKTPGGTLSTLRKGGSKERALAFEAMADEFYADMRDEDLYDEAHTTQAMSTYDITRMSQFSQVTTKIHLLLMERHPGLHMKMQSMTGAISQNWTMRKEGRHCVTDLKDAAIYKKILDRDDLKNKDEGVLYFKRTLRPFFVKGSVNVFLYRFQQFMNFRRGSSDLMKWMSRFQIQLKRLEEAWGDTLTPSSDPAHDEVRQYTQSLSAEVRQAMTAAHFDSRQ